MLAEWELKGRILMALPHENTDWLPILEEAQSQTLRIVDALLKEGKDVVLLVNPNNSLPLPSPGNDQGRLTIVPMQTNDTWTRDY